MPQADWFNIASFPQAQFITTGIKKTGENAYEANGTLTMKGMSKPVVLPFTLTPYGNNQMRAQGKVALMRNDFGIGQGEWSSESVVKREVSVSIDIVAAPKP